MKKPTLYYVKIPMLVMFFIFSMMMIHNGPASAGDYKMESNLNDLSELMNKWSKQLSSGKMDAKAQAKLSELLARTSEVLQELSAKKGGDMNMSHHMKIEQMKKEWDPFDTSDRM